MRFDGEEEKSYLGGGCELAQEDEATEWLYLATRSSSMEMEMEISELRFSLEIWF